MKGSLTRARWAAIGAAVAVSLGGGVVMVANAGISASGEIGFKAITPCRLLDTRTTETSQIKPLGIRHGLIGGANPNDLTVIFDAAAQNQTGDENTYEWSTGYTRPILGDCNDAIDVLNGIDSSDYIKSVLLNVTVVGNSSTSFITVYPWQLTVNSATRPFFSNLNPLAGLETVTNQVTVNLERLNNPSGDVTLTKVKCASGTHGASNCEDLYGFRVYNNAGTAHVILDVMGYYYDENGFPPIM